VELADGACTTVHVAAHPIAAPQVGASRAARTRPLAAWVRGRGEPEALVGGFYVRPHGTPLGELRTAGVARRHVAFDAPDAMRASCT
jgi:hypothetical protein